MPSSWSLIVGARDVVEGLRWRVLSLLWSWCPFCFLAAFVGSYALTCILNGASPQELTLLMGELFAKMQAYGGLVIAMFSS